MKKQVLIICFFFNVLTNFAQKPFVATFADTVLAPHTYVPFKIDTILTDPKYTKPSWYTAVLKLEKAKKFDEAYAIFEPKKNTDPLATYLLGKYFYLNLSTQTTLQKSSAFLWFFRASNKNFVPALNATAMMIALKEHNQKDSTAIAYLKKALQAGEKDANGKIAYLFHKSTQIKNNLDSAILWYHKAIAEKDLAAIHNLGVLYEEENEAQLMLAQYNEGSQKKLSLSNRRLGEFYYKGLGVEKDLNKAKSYFEKASNDDGGCNNFLGLISINDKKNESAFEYFSKSNRLNDIYGKYNLAVCLSEGIGTEQDPQRAFELYKSVSDTIAQAANNIGTLYERGFLGDNKSEAKNWYEKAANKDNIWAMLNLGRILSSTDKVTAMKWIEKAAASNNFEAISFHLRFTKSQNVLKAIRLAEKYANHPNVSIRKMAMRSAGDYNRQRADSLKKLDADKNRKLDNLITAIANKAIEWYTNAAELDDDSSMVRLGQLYYFGNIIKKDYFKVQEYWTSAAELNNVTAMYNLAYFYEKDTTLYKVRSYTKASDYYKKAIASPNISADLKKVSSFRLANLYQYTTSKDFGKNSKEALKWYQMAADLGDADAMYEIGYIYEHGSSSAHNENSVKVNKDEAENWYKKAALLNNEDAINALKKLGKQ